MRVRFRLLQRAVVLTALIGLVACSPPADLGRDTAQSTGPDTLASTDEFATGDGMIADRETLAGADLYGAHCAYCHDGSVAKAPALHWLEMMPPRAIVAAMTTGVMAEQAKGLSDADHVRIAEYITRIPLGDSLPPVARPPQCTPENAVFDMATPPAAVNWGHDARRFVPAQVGGLTASDLGQLELKWAYAFDQSTRGRSQPSIGMGAIYVGSEDGTVYAFDAATGCARWTFQAGAEVRTSIVLDSWAAGDAPARPLAYFGDIVARLYAVDARTGELVWSAKMDEHPSATLTATPLLAGGKLYVPVSSLEVIPAARIDYACCTFRGSVVAIDAATGVRDWTFYTIPNAPALTGETEVGTPVYAPSGAPSWVSPTIDPRRGVIYVGSGENYSSPADENSNAIFAVDIKTGKRVWQRQTVSGDAWNVACMMEDNPNCPVERGPDFDHSASILIHTLPDGRDILLTGHKQGTVFALDPDRQGELLWSTRVGRGSIQGGVHFGLAVDGNTVYVPINDMNNTRNGEFLDPALARPGMHAVDARDGRVLWSKVQENVCGENRPFCDPGISAAVTAIPGAVIAGHLDGHVRAYAQADGSLLWSVNTAVPVKGVSGVSGRGGGMSGSGVAVGDGYLAFNSGYGLYYHEPGNLFLVYGKKDR